VHCHSAHAHALGVPAATWAGAAVVVSRRVDFAVASHPLSRLKYRLAVDRYLCISRGVMEVMRRAGVAESRLALVPSGVELPDRAALAHGARDLRALIDVPSATAVVGTVAALAPHKNHADLLRAAARVRALRPDVHFVWVGEGECRAGLERERDRLGLEATVHLLGFRDDALALLAQFTLFALASYLEGLCTSLIDAQALGVPIVATDVGGIPDVVADGRTGRLVPARDPTALASAILEALAGPERARAWADAARRSVVAFGAERMVERTLQVYDEVLRERAARRGVLRG
jgi:glycosyltransferase involved in cell wall biosynthesis